MRKFGAQGYYHEVDCWILGLVLVLCTFWIERKGYRLCDSRFNEAHLIQCCFNTLLRGCIVEMKYLISRSGTLSGKEMVRDMVR